MTGPAVPPSHVNTSPVIERMREITQAAREALHDEKPPRDAPQLDVTDATAALRSDTEGKVAEGESSGFFAAAEAEVRELLASGRSAEDVARHLANAGKLTQARAAQLVQWVQSHPETAPSEGATSVESPPNPLRVQFDDDVAVEFEDAETAAQAQRAVMRRSEYDAAMADLERNLGELQQIDYFMERDPRGFMVNELTPERQIDVARGLLALPHVREALDANPPDPSQAIEDAHRWQATQAQARHAAAIQQQARAYRRAVESMLPASLPDEKAAMLLDDLLGDLAAYARQNPDRIPTREQLPEVLAERLKLYGVDPLKAARQLATGQQRTVRAPTDRDAIDKARNTGAQFKARREALRSAAAVPGAGAGAQPTKLQPPPKQGVADRIKWLREKLVGR